MQKARLNILPDAPTYQVGDFPSGRLEIYAPVSYRIKSLRLELVCSMVTPEQTIRRAFPLKVDNQPVGPGKYTCSMPFTTDEALYHDGGAFGKTSVEWSLEAKAVVVYPKKTPNGRRDSRPQVLEEKLPLLVGRAEASLSFTIADKDNKSNPGYVLVAIACFLLLLPFGWGVKLLVLAGLLYGLFYLEREMTRKHLFRGLEVDLLTDEAGRPSFRFISALEADDFMGGVVGVRLKERYLSNYRNSEGEEHSRTVRRALLNQFKSLEQSSRSGKAVICELPFSVNKFPGTLDFDENHGYAWTASYVCPRKYWMDVRVDWNIEVGMLSGK